jgi:trigger factor
MIVSQEIKKLEKSAVELKLTIAQAAARAEYDGLLAKYVKDAMLPGFRRGKVPLSVLEKKFGEGLKAEALQTLVDKSLHEVFETIDEKPLSYSQPEIIDKNLELSLDKDFTFTLRYDIFPKFDLPAYKGIEVEEPQVTLGQEDEKRELELIQEQNSMVIDKAGDAKGVVKVAKGDTVTVNYVELDSAATEIENTRRQDFVFTVGSGYNYYKIDEEIVGMKKDAEKNLSKSYPEDFETRELASSTRSLKVKVTAIKEKKLPEINDELAQDVSEEFHTLADLKKSINDRLVKNVENAVRQKNIDAVLEKVAAQTSFELPESMIRAEMENTWRNFAGNSRMRPEQLEQMVGPEGKQRMLDEWKPQSEVALRRRLVMEKILEAEQIECSPEELESELATQADASKITLEEARDYFTKNGLMNYLEHDVRDRKLADFLLATSKIKKGKKLSYVDLIGQKE